MKRKLSYLLISIVLVFTMFAATGCGDNAKKDRDKSVASNDKTDTKPDASDTKTDVSETNPDDVNDPTQNQGNNDNPGGETVEIWDMGTDVVRVNMTDTASAGTVTVLVYMNGSNLESEDGEATTDLSEMVAATYSDNVNVIVQTMGTKKWDSKFGISANKSQRYKIVNGGLKLIDDSLGQLDCTDPGTLLDFINWGTKRYPADRYILQFWNHGGGPVYGFGYDEWVSDSSASLSIDEIQLAVASSGVKFDFIGMDCCIMSSLEVCLAMYDCCDYMILSEEFETGLGWSYTGWLSALADNPSIDTVSLGKIIVDDMIKDNVDNPDWGYSSTLAVIEEATMKVLYTTWKDFAYANADTLLGANYSQRVENTGRGLPLLSRDDTPNLADYYVTDMMAVAKSVDEEGAAALESALNASLKYYKETDDETALTGLSVTLPYGDASFYNTMKSVFTNCGIEADYIEWLGNFVDASGSDDYYGYDDWDDDWSGWDDYYDDYDWSDWDYYEDDEYWDDYDLGWDDWDYSDYYDDSWYDDWYDDWYVDYDSLWDEYFGEDWDDEDWDEYQDGWESFFDDNVNDEDWYYDGDWDYDDSDWDYDDSDWDYEDDGDWDYEDGDDSDWDWDDGDDGDWDWDDGDDSDWDWDDEEDW